MNMDDVVAGKRPPPMNMGKVDPMAEKPPMPDEMRQVADEVDMKTDDAYASTSPVGEFHMSALNSMVQALNRVVPLFGVPEIQPFTEDATSFPPEIMRALTMVKNAAEDSGAQEFDLVRVKQDRDLLLLAGKLTALAKDRAFKDFLVAPARPKAAPTEQVGKSASTEAPPSDADMNELFASRSS